MSLETSGRLLALAAAVLLLAGCGSPSSDEASPEPSSPAARTSSPVAGGPTRTASPTHVVVPTATAPPSAVPTARNTLADAAESEATKIPTIVPISGPLEGADISWPQCPPGLGIPQRRSLGLPPPLPSAKYVVIGLTNGPGFYVNPCLEDQAAAAREQHRLAAAYAVVSYPDAATRTRYGAAGPFDGDTPGGSLANTGYQQARFNVGSMQRAGLESPIVWIDVESVAGFDWSPDAGANAAVVTGAARGYQDAGYAVGIYSTPYLWASIVGDLSLGVPEWRAAGNTSPQEALNRCGEDWVIQGGSGVLGQWVDGQRDRNLTCPGVSDLAPYFHRY